MAVSFVHLPRLQLGALDQWMGDTSWLHREMPVGVLALSSSRLLRLDMNMKWYVVDGVDRFSWKSEARSRSVDEPYFPPGINDHSLKSRELHEAAVRDSTAGIIRCKECWVEQK